MKNVVRFPTATTGQVAEFPAKKTAVWRRRLHECRTFYDAAALAYQIIRDAERAEMIAAIEPELQPQQQVHQLAFPWARAE